MKEDRVKRADPQVREAEGAAARRLVHGAHEHGGRAVQLRHDAEVARQPPEALVRQHGVRVLHRHRVLDGQHRPATQREARPSATTLCTTTSLLAADRYVDSSITMR